MKSTIQILHVVTNAGRSKKTGNDYDMRMAQCIVHKVNKDTGVIEPLVGELLLPQRYMDTVPGMYEVEFEVAISQQKRVESAVSLLTPIPLKATSGVSLAAPKVV
ncbi:hypothetical protein [Glaciimonas immobilis]|uniref:Single-stranded DNA-binding protein n=1 Tax=Glaciimonas immobilis TaxID=728004 RepID=A0A840RQR9_9BURK|nr:hypothetical protein [Glaciimonas immobilis]KAF3999444.1 hypothetical protein HAV38_05870 [Glaciimonas immobilis]MBB5198951.1 hypothetical protein [Glaciimonas immobilis]